MPGHWIGVAPGDDTMHWRTLSFVLLLPWAALAGCAHAPVSEHGAGAAHQSWLFVGGGPQLDGVSRVALDHAGNVYLAGWFKSRVVFGQQTRISRGGADVSVVKLRAGGQLEWVITLGSSGADTIDGLAVDPLGQVFVVGTFQRKLWVGMKQVSGSGRSMFVAKISTQGVPVWVKTYGQRTLWPAGVGLGPRGEVLVAVNFRGQVKLGGRAATSATQRGHNALVLALDHQGAPLWLTAIHSPRSALVHDLAVDRQGAAVLGGSFRQRVSAGKEQEWSRGGEDLFIASLNINGGVQWLNAHGGAGPDAAQRICVDEQRNVYVAGTLRGTIMVDRQRLTSRGSSDVLVIGTDSRGRTTWATTLGGSEAELPSALAADSEGNVLVAGLFSGRLTVGRRTYRSRGKDDMMVVELNGRGEPGWSMTAGGDQTQLARVPDASGTAPLVGLRDMVASLAVGPSGQLVLAGEFIKRGRFGRRSGTAQGLTDIFVWQLDRDRAGVVHAAEDLRSPTRSYKKPGTVRLK